MRAERDEDSPEVRPSSNEPNYHLGEKQVYGDSRQSSGTAFPPNREFGLQVLRHMRADGTQVYTIGVWEEGILRCICHAHPIATALVALSREFEDSAHKGADAPEYPRGRRLPS